MRLFILFFLLANLLSPAITMAQKRLITIGDSTMYRFDEERYSGSNEQRGWAQMLTVYLRSDVEHENWAKAGRSSKSFYYEYWQRLRDSIRPGDYVFIQFGHNDQKCEGQDSPGHDKNSIGTAAWGEYREYLTQYIEECRSRGAIPILFTPIVRNGRDENGGLRAESLHNLSGICRNDSLMNYPLSMRDLAEKMEVPLIDMTSLTRELVEEYGYQKARKYIYCRKDDTHLQAASTIPGYDWSVRSI